MAKWKAFSAGGFAPKAIRQILTALDLANSVTARALDLTKAQLGLMKVLAYAANANAVELALRAALDECLGYIQGLTANTGAHAIFIPIQKPYTGVSLIDSVPAVPIDTWLTAQDNLDSYTREVVAQNTPETINFISSAYANRGGNAGYWREFSRSLSDVGDLARPLFPPNYAVTGAAVVVGSSLLGPILGALDLLQLLLRGVGRLDSAYNARPRISDLRAHTVLMPLSGKLGVQLAWTPIARVLQQRSISTELYHVKKIAVVRSTDAHLRECFQWHEKIQGFPEEVQLDESDETVVVAVLDNDGFISGYVDEVDFEPGVTYYYALAAQYEISGVTFMSAFSNVERVLYRNHAMTTRRSEPPDWFATPSAIQLFPLIHEILSRAEVYIGQLMTRTGLHSGPVQVIERLIQQINMLRADAERIAREFQRLERWLRNISASDFAGLRATTITVERGGIYEWGTELARRLADRTDPSRPPYDHGELTAGIILVAGAPRLPQLAAIRKIIEILFGDGEEDPRSRAIRVLGGPTVTVQGTPLGGSRVVRTSAGAPSKKVYFDARLQPTSVAPVVPEKKPTFDDALQPSDQDPNC